jgi:hypothetical protein
MAERAGADDVAGVLTLPGGLTAELRRPDARWHCDDDVTGRILNDGYDPAAERFQGPAWGGFGTAAGEAAAAALGGRWEYRPAAGGAGETGVVY